LVLYGVLGATIIWLINQTFFSSDVRSARKPPTAYVPKVIVPRDFTKEQLREYDGSNLEKGIYVAVKGKVYDVSSRADFYGPQGSYHLFAGRDASRALALGSLEAADVENPSLTGLSFGELDALNDWASTYAMKYDVVGCLIEPENTEAACAKETSSATSTTTQECTGEKKEVATSSPSQ